MGIFSKIGQKQAFWRSNPLFGGFWAFRALQALPAAGVLHQPLAGGVGRPWEPQRGPGTRSSGDLETRSWRPGILEDPGDPALRAGEAQMGVPGTPGGPGHLGGRPREWGFTSTPRAGALSRPGDPGYPRETGGAPIGAAVEPPKGGR